jgi:phosphoglycolate phosphatase-like HAD superfamily hydrolase
MINWLRRMKASRERPFADTSSLKGLALLRERRVLFWDFDGVIKESVSIKTEAYARLFSIYGTDIEARVREHHKCNGGMSRLEKIPLYLKWAGQSVSAPDVDKMCDAFSALVMQAVVDSEWVPGAREFLDENYTRQRFVLVTATPQEEMEQILEMLGISNRFHEIHGAPTGKAQAIDSVIARWRCPRAEALVIGDSRSDYLAARATGVDFLLRQTSLNCAIQVEHSGLQRRDFIDE